MRFDSIAIDNLITDIQCNPVAGCYIWPKLNGIAVIADYGHLAKSYAVVVIDHSNMGAVRTKYQSGSGNLHLSFGWDLKSDSDIHSRHQRMVWIRNIGFNPQSTRL